MANLDFETLKNFAYQRENIGISIYLPYINGSGGNIKNPVELRNALVEAKFRLMTAGVLEKEADKLIFPAQLLADDDSFWRDKYETLALFLFLDDFQVFKLKFPVPKILTLSRYPQIRPIMNDYFGNTRVLVLVLEAGGSRLFLFDKYSNTELTPKPIMISSKEYASRFQLERETNIHIGRKGGGGHDMKDVISHGHDNTAQLDKVRAIEYAHLVAKEVKKFTNQWQIPLIIAGDTDSPLLSSFSEIFDGQDITPQQIRIEMPINMKKLALEVNGVIADIESRQRKNLLEKVSGLLGTGLGTTDTVEIVRKAINGGVEALFATDGAESYGYSTDFNGETEIAVSNDPNDEDLINLAAIETLRSGGKVQFVDSEMIGGEAMLAGFRY